MADNTETEIPIWGDELKDFIDIGTNGVSLWIEITNLLSFEPDDDETAYEPEYINLRRKKKFIMDSSASIDLEKDAYRNNALDAWFMEHEDDKNISCRICRVRSWENNKAKAAKFLCSPKQLDKNTFGEALKIKANFSMADDNWTYGTFQDGVFIPDGATVEPTDPSGPGSDEDGTEDLQG